ncbi:MAG: TVP38/TMEM64 family protein [Elainellaceae cyanobacterium]
MSKRRFRVLLTRQNGIALAVLLISLLAAWWLATHTEIDLYSGQSIKRLIANSGAIGILVYISIIALSVVVSPIPGAPLAMAAGAVWGTLPAAFYSVVGGFLGGVLAYFIGRSLGRSAVQAITGKLIYFSKDRGEVYLGYLIFFTRLLPVLSFDLVSYAAGLTGLSFPIFAAATLLGMIPSTLLLTYMGAAFTVGLPLGIGLAIGFVILLVVLPWGIRRYNWFGMRDIIHIE